MAIDIMFQILGGLAFLAGAVISLKKGAVQFKSGFQLQRNTDPLMFWALIIVLGGGSLLFFIHAAVQLVH